jgi:hypothetical protein
MIAPEHIAKARALLGWPPSVLAFRAARLVTTNDIRRAEEGDETALSAEQLSAIAQALIRAGVEFDPDGTPVLARRVLPKRRGPKLRAFWPSIAVKGSLYDVAWELLVFI